MTPFNQSKLPARNVMYMAILKLFMTDSSQGTAKIIKMSSNLNSLSLYCKPTYHTDHNVFHFLNFWTTVSPGQNGLCFVDFVLLSNAFSSVKMFEFWLKFLCVIMKFVSKGPIHKRSTLVPVMTWCWKQAVTWTNLDNDISSHIAPPGYNELTYWDRDKWPPISWRHFQVHFLEWKCTNFAYVFTKVCSKDSIWQYPGIGSDNGLAPTRRQVIIWTNDS